ncbi:MULTISPECIES: hypothetical protein [unclassified Microbacterium]|uniref:hypothetical protein n=1 Tax=unclassified Microbacterium TaxID=2609290 RepID=UPI000EA8D1A8|nr:MULTISPECIES: hypothetical protein [unclassified Microbacterium]MBT2486125.1 hypothetical protein [Microbacterium sp. ISL-108]RKN68855.1 hypothetical protein D7252_15575 [Microbacterium sp. CGR2]
MNTSLSRNIAYWLLLVGSLASVFMGGWLILGQIGTMTTTLLDGTATGIEVYVGQSLVVVGAVVLGAGIIGLLLALALGAAKSLRSPVTVVDEPADDTPAAEVSDRADSDDSDRSEARADAAIVDDAPADLPDTRPETEAQPAVTR